jgi:phosphohistidine phosphatase
MKTLYLLRHAKSSWTEDGLADFDRPLNARGLKAAPFMGSLIADKGLVASIAISSPAKRAWTTAELVKEAGGASSEIRLDDRIYEASPQMLRRVVAEVDDEHDSALIIGHNPGLEGLIYFLTGTLEPMPTAALAVISLDISSWADVDASVGDVVRVYRPREEVRPEPHVSGEAHGRG